VYQQTTNSSGDNVMSCSVSRPFFLLWMILLFQFHSFFVVDS